MPAKSRKSPHKSQKRRSSSKRASSPVSESAVISKSMSFTSNPSKGEPYGTFEEVVMKNGKGKRVTGKLNKSGKQFDKKESKINGRQSRCTAINITTNPLISGPGPAFFL